MRRRVIGVMAVVAAFALIAAACNKTTTTTTGGGSPSAPTTSSAPAITTLTPGVLSVGSCLDYKPFESVPPGGEPTGFDVELTEAIAAKLGLQVEWVKAGFGTIFSAVAANKFDMVAAASTITAKRDKTVDFSDPYFDADQALTVNTTKTPDITSADDLGSGDVVGVQSGTTGEMYAIENLKPNGVDIKSFPEIPQAFTDLEAGNVQGVINDAPSSSAEIKTRPGLEVVQTFPTGEHYGFAFAPTNPGLREAVNAALQEIIADGTYEQIFMKYLPGIPVPPAYQAA